VDFLLQYGYLGIIVYLVLTGCGMPFPEEIAIIWAGVVSSQGHLQTEWAAAACLFGALVGDCVMYAIGYHYGHNLMAKHPKLGKFVGAEREEFFEQSILRHGFKVMLLARFMVGVRGPVYLAAGVVRMPFRKFLLWDFVCATLVVGTFFSLSYAYGKQITELVRDAEWTLTLVIAALALTGLLWWMRHRRKELLDEAVDLNTENGPLTKVANESKPHAGRSEQTSPERASKPNGEVA